MRPTIFTWLAFAFLGMCIASSAQAERLVRIAVLVDGKPVLEGHAGDDGFASPYLVWQHLKGAALNPSPGFQVEPAPEVPERATLKGEVVVDVQYAARVKTNELPLMLVAGNWQIDPAWIAATGPKGDRASEQSKTNALRAQVIARDLTFPLLVAGSLLLIAVIAVLVVMFSMSKRKSNEAAG